MAADRTFVTNSIPPRFLRYVRSRGGDADALQERFGFAPDVETRADVRTRMEVLMALADASAEMLHDPWLGLHVAESLTVG